MVAVLHVVAGDVVEGCSVLPSLARAVRRRLAAANARKRKLQASVAATARTHALLRFFNALYRSTRMYLLCW